MMCPRSMTRSFIGVVILIDACTKECVGGIASHANGGQMVTPDLDTVQFRFWHRYLLGSVHKSSLLVATFNVKWVIVKSYCVVYKKSLGRAA